MNHTKVAGIIAGVLIIALLLCNTGVTAVQANNIAKSRTVRNTKVISAGYGGMRGIGTGTLSVSGVSGSVTKALLYWHGPTRSTSPNANAVVSFAGHTVTGTNIGFSSDNCWGFTNSQAYRADVTSFVRGNGKYALGNFVKGSADVNGASLIVFFDDGDATTNQDVVIFDGNDSNRDNSYDDPGWNVTLNDIAYTAGDASLELHVSDGQSGTNFDDDALVLNQSTVLAARGEVFQGDSVPAGSGGTGNGSLWDIKSYDVASALKPGQNTLQLTSGDYEDCLSLIVALVKLPVGAAPPDTNPPPDATPVAARKQKQGPPAQVIVYQEPNPNTIARRDGTVTYSIVVKNVGKGSAKDAVVTMPFDAAEAKVIDATFSRKGPWVSELITNTLEFRTGPLASGGDTITATVRLSTLPSVADNTSLAERLTYRWDDDRSGGDGRSNLPILVVGGSDTNQQFYTLSVEPASGPAGSTHSFKTTIFVPDEPITFWYNAPDGKVVALKNLTANDDGVMDATFTTIGLPAGNYSMVARGNWTGFTAVGTFKVQ